MVQTAPIEVLFEDNHLLVVNKPAGIATMGSEAGAPSVARWAADYLKKKYSKPGNVFIGVVSRIDSRVSGALLLARTSKAASRISEQIRNNATEKRYLAWVEGHLPTNEAWIELVDWMAKNERQQRMVATSKQASGAKEARLRLRTIASIDQSSLVEVDLITGRKHQIRLQLSEFGHPVIGDTKYGSTQKFDGGIALHCYRLSVEHPTKREPMVFAAPLATSWRRLPQPLKNALAAGDDFAGECCKNIGPASGSRSSKK